MSGLLLKSDREKWDQRYSAEPNDIPAPDPFLVQHSNILNTGRALDLACGRGGNAVFLAERGYRVDAVDISFVALSRLRAEADRRRLDIDCVVADLDDFWLPESFYELVVVFYFFSESLVHGIKDTLKPGGLLFYATFNRRHTSVQPGFNPDYLVEPEALGKYFAQFEILIHEPEAGEDRNISRLIGKRRPQ
ncbi:MAG TPA: class I SAM-dependent methyltransferase [Desulfomonilaceae bacterium]|nr:class I SAM-dependent methyltransferase [Desulfomonilaceae bacterium]